MLGLVIQHINIGSKRCVFFISLSVAINYTIFLSFAEEIALRIMATTDLHTSFTNYNYYTDAVNEQAGFVKIATLINKNKDEMNIMEPVNRTLEKECKFAGFFCIIK